VGLYPETSRTHTRSSLVALASGFRALRGGVSPGPSRARDLKFSPPRKSERPVGGPAVGRWGWREPWSSPVGPSPITFAILPMPAARVDSRTVHSRSTSHAFRVPLFWYPPYSDCRFLVARSTKHNPQSSNLRVSSAASPPSPCTRGLRPCHRRLAVIGLCIRAGAMFSSSSTNGSLPFAAASCSGANPRSWRAFGSAPAPAASSQFLCRAAPPPVQRRHLLSIAGRRFDIRAIFQQILHNRAMPKKAANPNG